MPVTSAVVQRTSPRNELQCGHVIINPIHSTPRRISIIYTRPNDHNCAMISPWSASTAASSSSPPATAIRRGKAILISSILRAGSALTLRLISVANSCASVHDSLADLPTRTPPAPRTVLYPWSKKSSMANSGLVNFSSNTLAMTPTWLR